MGNVTEEKWIEMLEKKSDGNYIVKYPKVKSKSGVTFEGHLADGAHMPSGGIIMWSGAHANIPTGWLLCDGNNDTPDLRDRFILGATTESDIGETGGEHEVTLTVDQMPSHNHGGSTNSTGSHTHTIPVSQTGSENTVGSGTRGSNSGVTGSSGTHSHTISTQGGDQPHENRPAFYKLAFIIKV